MSQPETQPGNDSETPFRYVHSDSFPQLLKHATLMVTTYQAGKLCVFRGTQSGLALLPRTFDKAMGLAVDPNRLAIATRYQIWFLPNERILAAKIEPRGQRDACYVPRRSHVTGNIDLHEIAWSGEELWVVNTLFSCLCTLDDRFSFVPRWRPPFVSQLIRQDRCHLNGVAMRDGWPCYVTAFAATDSPEGWREHKREGGVVVHVESGEIVARGLSMPHSPRLHAGRLWALDSGNARLITVDLPTGRIDTVAKFDGYARGLAFHRGYAFVGLSQVREDKIFGGVAISEQAERKCGVSVVELATGRVVAFLDFEATVQEIFDVQILPHVRYPEVVGFKKDTIERACVIAPEQPINRPEKEAPPNASFGIAPRADVNTRTSTSDEKRLALAHNQRGLASVREQDWSAAVESFGQAAHLDPGYAKAHSNLGRALTALGRYDEAGVACCRAIQIEPHYATAHNNLGNALWHRGQLDQAMQAFRTAVGIEPHYALAQFNLGSTLVELGEYDEAVDHLAVAIDRDPSLVPAYTALAKAYAGRGQIENALSTLETAHREFSEDADVMNDLALTLQDVHRVEESIELLKRAIATRPDDPLLHTNLSFAQLRIGNFARGWLEYEWRLKMKRPDAATSPARRTVLTETEVRMLPRQTAFPQPPWDGSSLTGRRLLVWGEQGIGDELMFASMISEQINAGADCILECDHRCVPLFSRSFPAAEVVCKSDPPDARTMAGDIDFQCAIGSLGNWLRPELDSFARATHPYLAADPQLRQRLRAAYQTVSQPLLVGISWRSGNPKFGRQRSAELRHWGPLLRQPGWRFVNLQYGDCQEELAQVRRREGVEIHHDREVDPVRDLDLFAAQVDAMDLIISIDNSTVHMAGALGKPVWTLLSCSSDWRWMLDRADTPWYPSMRLFRQPTPGDWPSVFEQVVAALPEIASTLLERREQAITQPMNSGDAAEAAEQREPWRQHTDSQASDERRKYERIWQSEEYRQLSPGLEHFEKVLLVDRLRQHGVKTVLDAGCGTGKLMKRLISEYGDEFEVHGFDISDNCLDPFFDDRKHNLLTVGCLWDADDFHRDYDAIICTDVMEHIPTDRIATVLANFHRHTRKLCYLAVALFPDGWGPRLLGEPLHLTVKPAAWWLDQFSSIGFQCAWQLVEKHHTGQPMWLHAFLLSNGSTSSR